MKNLFFISLLLLGIHSAFGQAKRIIRVEDSLSREPIIAATVRTAVKPVTGAVTDATGIAVMPNLPATVHTLTVSAVGYETQSFSLSAAADTLVFRLHSQDASLDEVTVTATRTNSRIEDLPIKVEVLGQEDMDEESAVVPGNVSSILGDI